MRSKTDNSIKTARFLISTQDVDMCTASIHCSYYAAFQYMKYCLANGKRPVSYEEQETKCKSNGSSHEKILEMVADNICSIKEKRNVKISVKWLKKQRIAADYTPIIFNVEDCKSCLAKATGIIKKLKTIFGL